MRDALERFLTDWGMKPARPRLEGDRRSLQLLLKKGDERIPVGTLSQTNEGYVFRYSEEFQSLDLPPLPGFPDTQKEYKSRMLWPFFQVRVPPSTREDVARVVRKENINPDDLLEMLRVLGGHVATSPYELADPS